ncbi:RNA-directed DNA polymerase from mobile element jockey [Trichonephila clavipes]|uniref:RNA-directed DNA polymerase from mobile element jockey n=1 Tax=Trichonephila clavipes TaxID=2585209 RepID=A0A8X6VVK2_TRICX|nr:RNA-directed DNA polymerase from mobile element jockey [Trichonephila clavipes]
MLGIHGKTGAINLPPITPVPIQNYPLNQNNASIQQTLQLAIYALTQVSRAFNAAAGIGQNLNQISVAQGNPNQIYGLIEAASVLRPILSYGCPVWGYAAKTNINILDVAQNTLIRMIVGASIILTFQQPIGRLALPLRFLTENFPSEEISFSQKRPPPEITLQNQRIPWSQHTKYLGVVIDKNLTFRQHITHVRNKFKNATSNLYPLICRKSKLNRHNKLLIYTLILKPLLTYASPIWAHAARSNINLIESSQNVILRQILDGHWYMRNADIRSALKIPTIRQTIRKLAVNFFSNVDGHENPSIQAISTYPTYPFIRRPRVILIDPNDRCQDPCLEAPPTGLPPLVQLH